MHLGADRYICTGGSGLGPVHKQTPEQFVTDRFNVRLYFRVADKYNKMKRNDQDKNCEFFFSFFGKYNNKREFSV